MQPTALDEAIATARPGVERLQVHQFHRMIETGILREGEPIELIDGILVRKDSSDAGGDPMTHGPKHAFCVQRLKRLEKALAGHHAHLRQQLPLTLGDDREPEPDIAIVRGRDEDYIQTHPGAADCLLVIDVADGSLEYDRTVKLPIYAAAAIPIYVIANIGDRQIEVYEEVRQDEATYAGRRVGGSGDRITLELGDGISVEIHVDEVFP